MAKKPLSPRIFHDPDGDLLKLTGKTVGIIGYGNQGRAQALNLRDSNIPVIIGNRKDDYMERAIADNFEVYDISKVVQLSDIIFLLINAKMQVIIKIFASIYTYTVCKHICKVSKSHTMDTTFNYIFYSLFHSTVTDFARFLG